MRRRNPFNRGPENVGDSGGSILKALGFAALGCYLFYKDLQPREFPPIPGRVEQATTPSQDDVIDLVNVGGVWKRPEGP